MGRKKDHEITKYAKQILSGKIPANKWTRLSCARHIKDLKRKDICFDEAAADHIISFFPRFLTFYEGAFDGEPFNLTPHQKFIVGSIFGWKNAKDGYRRFRTAYIEEGKGQGKSPMAGGIGLYCLIFDDEPGAEVYSAAVTRDQAGILFRDARLFAEASPLMRELLQVDKFNIAYLAQNSYFRPISSERRGLDGKRPHAVLVDEIHEHRNDIVVRKMSAGTKGRRQSLMLEITNAGYDRHSICFQHHEHTANILEGIVEDDAWFGLMTGLDTCEKHQNDGKTVPQDGCKECDDWRDPKVWVKANPNLEYLGQPFKDYLARQVAEAIAMPSQENIVKRLNFCIWTESITKWLSADKWNSCDFPVLPDELTGRTCYAGLDLSTNTDLTAYVLVFPPESHVPMTCQSCGAKHRQNDLPVSSTEDVDDLGYFICPDCEPEMWTRVPLDGDEGEVDKIWRAESFKIRLISDGKYEILCRFFLPEDNMRERVQRDKVPFDVWAREGYISLTPGDFIDYGYILHQIKMDMGKYHIAELAFDRWGSAKIMTDLQDMGFLVDDKSPLKQRSLIPFGQGYGSMNAPTKEVEKMVMGAEFAHGGNPVLAWNISNVAIKQDPAGNVKPDKEKAVERIDGAVALIMATGRAMLGHVPFKSQYETISVKVF